MWKVLQQERASELVIMSRIKLTDKQKKKIIADFISNTNYSETARMNNVSDTTVRKIIKENPECLEKVEEKKAENTKSKP